MSYLPIENYGVIGDLHTVALVGQNGSSVKRLYNITVAKIWMLQTC
jgi:hypothetical protein